jgi:hypothetical protein
LNLFFKQVILSRFLAVKFIKLAKTRQFVIYFMGNHSGIKFEIHGAVKHKKQER